MIAFACSHCGMKFKVKDQFAGRSTRCPTCKELLVVPQLSSVLAVADPLIDGITELVGATDAHPELRLTDTWIGAGEVVYSAVITFGRTIVVSSYIHIHSLS